MAVNEIQMKKFSEGSSGTGGRVGELTLPVDISHRSRSQQAHANEKDLDLELNLQKENFGSGPSGGSSEDDELVHTVSESRSEAEVKREVRITILEPIREEDQDDGGRTHQPVGDPEKTDLNVTVKVSDHICRTCGPDDEITEPDNLLVTLGCHCRGSLSRMHRKCILEWYGPRICQENNYKCELCNAVLHGRIERIVFRALIGQDSGNDILVKAMGLAPRPLTRSRAYFEPSTLPETNGNADPGYHQMCYQRLEQINIVDITHSAQRPRHPVLHPAPDQADNHGSRGGYPICVLVFIILVLIGFAVAGVAKH